MCSISDIPLVGTALTQISEATVGALKREFCYLLYYKDNVQTVKTKLKELGDQEEEIGRKVVRDTGDAKTIKDNVVEWRNDAVQMKDQGKEFLKKCDDKPSWTCYKVVPFPNLYSRFRLGREAVKMTERITGLTDPGKEFVAVEIAYLPRFEYMNNPISSNMTTYDYLDFGSRKVAYWKLWEALEKEDGPAVVGIFGMPGVGKTKMMEEASDKARQQGIFDKVARADVSEAMDIQKIQGQLASCLQLHLPSEANEKERAFLLEIRLKQGEKFLIILDDVWEEIPLKDIGIPFADGSVKGCKILLTSRKQDACVSNNCEHPVEVEPLNVDEAWDLFRKNVGSSTIDNLADKFLARKVCEECACLSLVIVAVGKALKGKAEVSWKDALGQLKDSQLENIVGINPKVHACLQLSFNQLHTDEKLCLLLCSLFDQDAEISVEHLLTLAKGSGLLKGFDTLESARTRVHSMVANLKSSSLLLEGQEYDTVKLHDIIRDVARSIAVKDREYAFLSKSCDSEWPVVENHIGWKLMDLNFKSDIVDFSHDLVCPDLHTLSLKCSNPSQELPDSFFSGFVNLRVLFLNNVSFSPLASPLPNIANLRMLTIYSFKSSDIPLIVSLKNLEMLTLRTTRLVDLPVDLRGLKRLRMLDLKGCKGMVLIQHVLSSLSSLEELHIPKRFRICDVANQDCPIHDELSKLTRLTNLEIHFIDSMSCPDINIFKTLLRFKISVGEGYESWHHRSAPRSLKVVNKSLEGGAKTLVERSEEVCLQQVSGLKNFFTNIDGEAYLDLTSLKVIKCYSVELLARIPQNNIPHQLRSFSKLSVLKIKSSGFKYLFCPSIARCLVQLQKLGIFGCEMLEEIVRNESPFDNIKEIIVFPKLRSITLSSLPMLTSFCRENQDRWSRATDTPVQSLFNGQILLPSLEMLEIRDMKNVREIWGKHYHIEESFCQLKILKVYGCNKLEKVIPSNMIKRLQNLEELSVGLCKSVISEVEGLNGGETEIRGLPRLTKLTLSWLPKCSKTGLNSRENTPYRNLTTLTIEGCNNLRNVFLPSVARDLMRLEVLCIVSCESMKEIIAKVGDDQQGINADIVFLPMLKGLHLRKLPNLSRFWCYGSVEPSSINRHRSFLGHKVALPSLKTLRICSLGSVQYLFSAKVFSPALETLEIQDLKILRDIWENQCHLEESFSQLKILKVEECHTLENVIPLGMLERLINLEELSVRYCDSLICEVEGLNGEDTNIVSLPRLMKLRLRNLPKLTKTWLNSMNFTFYPNLTTLTIERCNNMRNVFLLEASRTASMEPPNLQSLFSDKVAFLFLKTLIIYRLDSVQLYLFSEKVLFPSLERLEILYMRNIGVIWEKQGHREDSFCQLKILKVEACHNLRNVIPFFMLQRLHNLEELCVRKCSSVISEVEGLNGPGETTLSEVEGPNGIGETTLLGFLRLKKLTLSLLPKLRQTWLNSTKFTLYPNLMILIIDRCDILINVFLPSVARELVHLKELRIDSCDMMNEIISTIGEGQEAINEDIVFLTLKVVVLRKMGRLKGFWGYGPPEPCNINQKQANIGHKVVVPSLEEFEFNGTSHRNVKVYTMDLNNHVQQILKRGGSR